jgi:hypothetical protein
MTEAIERVANALNIDPAKLISACAEDKLGGYGDPGYMSGSIYGSEGRLLYGLIRCTKPEYIVEVGRFYGVSLKHMASACLANEKGLIDSVDTQSQPIILHSGIMKHIRINQCDIRDFSPQGDIGFVFEDADHNYDTAKATWQSLKSSFAPVTYAVMHDWFEPAAAGAKQAFIEELGQPDVLFIKEPSTCGLAIKKVVDLLALAEETAEEFDGAWERLSDS